MSDIYATNKLRCHPDRIASLREHNTALPVQIHLMPQNLCNHDCHFCSYRMSGWKNSQQFDDRQQIPWDIMEGLLADASRMGVKAVEVTGGGEPLIYEHRDKLFGALVDYGFDIGLVTNGTAITEKFAKRFGPHLTWARISLDAGRRETYVKVRRVHQDQWHRALRGVSLLRKTMSHPEARLGCGFVATKENQDEILEFLFLARLSGADNVRLSVVFGPEGNSPYRPDLAEKSIEAAIEVETPHFKVHNLIPERLRNQGSPEQDYDECHTQDLLCVVGGDSKVYTCCTLAFTPTGEIGSLRDRSFWDIWQSRERLSPREHCKVPCLYELRNLEMLEIVRTGEIQPAAVMPHRNFI